MVSVCFYFQVHQPYRLRNYHVFDIGHSHNYFDDKKNKEVLIKVAKKCYLPSNRLILDLINRLDGKFKVSYSITGVAMEQFEEYYPEVIDSFKELAKTGCVEFLSETYHHSLSYLFSRQEFKEQVEMHKKMLWKYFKKKPSVFRNTELIFNNELAKFVESLGYKGVLAEGCDHILGWRSPNFLYKAVTAKKIKVLLKNYRLSDDIAFRFSERSWKEWPLTAEKFAVWLDAVNGNCNCINLFLDYETFGEHQWESTGIFDFLRHLPFEFLKNKHNNFKTVSEAIKSYEAVGEIDVPYITSWADIERDLSAWLGNPMQNNSIRNLYLLEKYIKESKNKTIINDWRKLQISDHFYYMCTKWFNDGDVHKYFNPYNSPHEAFISFNNALLDLRIRLKKGGYIDANEKENFKKRSMAIPTRCT